MDILKNETGIAIIENDSALNYGKYHQTSAICGICSSSKHNEINLMRCKSYMSYKDISKEIGLSPGLVKKHFDHHFIISTACQKIISIREHTNNEAQEIVRMILEEDLDIVSAVKGVNKSLAIGLSQTEVRLSALQEEFERGKLEEGNTNTKDYFQMRKIHGETLTKIMENHKILDTKWFPKQDDFAAAFHHYQLNYLRKMVDNIQTIFIETSNESPEYNDMINKMRMKLAQRINMMELEVMDTLNPATKKAIETKVINSSEVDGEIIEEKD